jgi:amino acid permease
MLSSTNLKSHPHTRYQELIGVAGSDSPEQSMEVGPGNPLVKLIPLRQSSPTPSQDQESGRYSPLRNNSSALAPIYQGQGTLLSSTFSIANTLLGSSILGLAYAFSHTGWFLGTFLMVVCASSSAFALHSLACCALRFNALATEKNASSFSAASNKRESDFAEHPIPVVATVPGSSFYSIAKLSLPRFTVLIDVAIASKCFGVAVSYLIVVGDLMPLVMQQFGVSGFFTTREPWVCIGFSLAAPLCFLRDLKSLSYSSRLALGFVLFFAVLVLLFASGYGGSLDPCASVPQGADCTGPIEAVASDSLGILKVFPIFIFGFTCHQVLRNLV